LWAGFCALVNQQSVGVNGTTVGFLNPTLYAIANSTNYNACFHDITTGNNIGTGTPGLFNSVTGYDLCTGLGTPNGTNLINALAPLPYTTPLINGVALGSTGGVFLSLSGASNYTYILEVTTNLISPGGWQPIATNKFDENNVWQFTDTLATNFTQRFYRLELAH
jgi:hypothetical protein